MFRICIGSRSYRLNRFSNLALLERHAYKVFASSKTGMGVLGFGNLGGSCKKFITLKC
jgi:hypothetical protein